MVDACSIACNASLTDISVRGRPTLMLEEIAQSPEQANMGTK